MLVQFHRFDVAIKIATDEDAKDEMLHEAKSMARLSKHKHIVNLQGICLHQNETYLILEFCSLGSVESYLQKHYGHYSQCLKDRDYYFMLKCCLEVIEGMQFLVAKGITHGDLAARNVLITHDATIKLADFGLSHRMYLEQDSRKSFLRKGPKTKMVPFRYSAYEVVTGKNVILEKSDVWSCAVYMWEVFQLGSSVPYFSLVNGKF